MRGAAGAGGLSYYFTFAGWFVRGLLAWLLVLFTLFLAMAWVGVGNATTDASAAQLLIGGGIYAVASWSALAYSLLGTKEWLRWGLLIVPLSPVLLVVIAAAVGR